MAKTNTINETPNSSTVNYFDRVKEFKTGNIFGLYFLKFILSLLCLAVMAGVLLIPFINPNDVELELALFDFNFTGCTSIFNLVLPVVQGIIDGSKGLIDLDPFLGAGIIWGIFLIIGILWAVIKLIRSLILIIFAFAKKQSVVTEMIAAIQHREHIYGMLSVDKLFFYTIIVVGLIFTSTIFDLETLIGLRAFTAFHSYTLITFGSICFFAAVALLIIVGIIYLIARGGCKRKIKKHFGIK